MAAQEIDPATLEDLYTWVDQVDLSRPKRDIKRDFSDGGVFEFCKGFFSKYELVTTCITLVIKIIAQEIKYHSIKQLGPIPVCFRHLFLWQHIKIYVEWFSNTHYQIRVS